MSVPTEVCIPQEHVYLTRMRGNIANALADHANLVDLMLALVLVTRGHNRPDEIDIDDAATLAAQLYDLNEIRKPIGGAS